MHNSTSAGAAGDRRLRGAGDRRSWRRGRPAPPYPALRAEAGSEARQARASRHAHARSSASGRGGDGGARRRRRARCGVGRIWARLRRRGRAAAQAVAARRAGGARRRRRQLRDQDRRPQAAAAASRPPTAGRSAEQALLPLGTRHLFDGGGHRDGARLPQGERAALRTRRRHLRNQALSGPSLPVRRACRRGPGADDRAPVAGAWRHGGRGAADRPGLQRRPVGLERSVPWPRRRWAPWACRRGACPWRPSACEGRTRPAVKVGIVGLPNAGKTTLFNALTRAAAETASYPFTTVEPNVAIVEVPDGRLAPVAAAAEASPLVPETIEFRDIAGLVRGAASGEGLGNRFLAAIRETDALCHVVRAHSDEGVPHPEGGVDPARDIETVDGELRQADLETGQRRLEHATRQAHSGDKQAVAERDWLERVVETLRAGQPARTIAPPDAAPRVAADLQALTSKPVLYVANVDEGEA